MPLSRDLIAGPALKHEDTAKPPIAQDRNIPGLRTVARNRHWRVPDRQDVK
jgi:hypothetical protein